MSAAARGAAGITLRRLLEGRKEVSEDLMLALYRAQSELDFIARGYTPAVSEILAKRELGEMLKKKAA
jgi:hypothetical protein